MKYTKNIIIIISIILIFVVGCKKTEEDIIEKDYIDKIEKIDENHIDKEEETLDPIIEFINSMSLEKKIGQLLIVGFEGTDINQDLEKYINQLNIGGYILFSRNIKSLDQTINLINNMKDLNKENEIPLLLSIDEEGGRVSRLSKEFVKLPPPGEVGRKNNRGISYEYGKILGERLNILGLNMNFNPVLDINSNPKNPVIGDRSFGNNAELVIANSKEVISGSLEQNIISVAKHFPGHGDTSIDSHFDLPMVNKSLDELMEFELLPFIDAIYNGIDGIMIGHILFPEIDKDYPATLSSKIIEDILRKELNFNGVVFSDDMTMGAIMNNYSLEEAVVKFIKSGGDMALVCHGKDNPEIVINRIIEAVKDGQIEEENINEKVYRILKLKKKYNLKENLKQDINIEDTNTKSKNLIKNLKYN